MTETLHAADDINENTEAGGSCFTAEDPDSYTDNSIGGTDDTVNKDETQVHKHKKCADPGKWKESVQKEKRLKGETYKNKKGTEVPAKSMGPPCTSSFCRKSKRRKCQSLTEEHRKEIFERFWGMASWEERRSYINRLVHKVNFCCPFFETECSLINNLFY